MEERPLDVLRHPLWQGAGRGVALASASPGRGLGRDQGRLDLRCHCPAVGGDPRDHRTLGSRSRGATQRRLLSLNVWTPALPEIPPRARAGPAGDGVDPWRRLHVGERFGLLYRGGSLVRNGDAVVVTINYRLGALGFLAHRDLGDPDGLWVTGASTTSWPPCAGCETTSPSSAATHTT